MKVGMLTFQNSRYLKYVGTIRYEESLISGLNKIGIEIEKIILNEKEIGIHPVINRIWLTGIQYFSGKKRKYDVYHASSQFTATRYVDVVTVHDVIGLKNIP
ncbi:MAG: hypothetical protein QXN45_04935, partial [Candidatus Thermoplasmatota archaeon]